MPSAVALIPARSGSTRVPGKNVRPLAGHPLLAYSIAAAQGCGKFEATVVSTDSDEIAQLARGYGAEVPELRPASTAGSTSPDIEWVRWALDVLDGQGRSFDLFSILRPTSPFRTEETIRRAWECLLGFEDRADSIRAVELCRQHPGKMWVLEGDLMSPLLEGNVDGVPFHSSQYQALAPVYAQNSSLEIAWTRVVREHGEIAGPRVIPFHTEGDEGFTIDYPDDWLRAEALAADGTPLPSLSPSAAPR